MLCPRTPPRRPPAPRGPRRALLGALASSLVAFAPAGAALAAPPGEGHESLYVLQLADHDALEQARALSTALRQRVNESKDFALGNSTSSLEALASRCAKAPLVGASGGFREPSRGCQEQIGTALRIGTLMPKPPYVWGLMYRSATPPGRLIVRVHLWREGREDALVEQPYDEALVDPKAPALVDLSDYLLQRLLHGEEVGRARVTAPAGAGGELWVDGEARGRIEPGGAREVAVRRGAHAFEVRAGGRVLGRARASVAAGAAADVRLAPAGGVAPPAEAATPAPGDDEPVGGASPAASAAPRSRAPAAALPWVVGGVGAAALVAGGVFFALERSAAGNLDDTCAGACPPRAGDDIDRSKFYGALWPVALGAGAAGLGAAAFLFLQKDERPATARAPWRVRGTVQPLAGGAAAGVAGSF